MAFKYKNNLPLEDKSGIFQEKRCRGEFSWIVPVWEKRGFPAPSQEDSGTRKINICNLKEEKEIIGGQAATSGYVEQLAWTIIKLCSLDPLIQKQP